MKKRLSRMLAVVLSFCLLLGSASALTADQLKALLEENYIDEIPESILSQATVEEILEALGDPYTTYFTAEEYAQFLASMEDSTKVGLGVALQTVEQGWMISDVIENSGAATAGVLVGETITAVDGQSVAGVSVDDASTYLAGEEGTQVTVTLLDGAGNTREVTVTRTSFTASITASVELLKDHIGYIDCTAFGSETYQHFVDGITANDEAADIWLVDLRLNGGGDTNSAVYSAATLSGGAYSPLAYLKDRTGEYGGYYVMENYLSADRSIVLVSQYTASAAELFSTVIRDRAAGIIVGTRTYGKGVAQIILDETTNPDEFQEGDALKLTAYRVYSYIGTTTDKIGVVPDLLISDEHAADAALLMCDAAPADSTGYIRLTLGGSDYLNYYISLAEAQTDETTLAAFTELLEAVPPSASVCLGTGGEEWVDIGASAVAMTYCPDYVSRSFTDVASSSYKTAINTLATYDILNGIGNGLFDPEDTLTRAEFCALLAQVLNDTGDSATAAAAFSDVSESAWYADEVAAMYQLGFFQGFEDGTFRPDATITHEQLLTVCARFGEWLNKTLNSAAEVISSDAAAVDTTAVDNQGFADWSTDSVWLLNYYQWLYTDLTQIDPTGATQREEAAAMMYNLLCGVGVLRA